MSGRRWLECVERELSRSTLPRQEVARLVAELSDHLADVMESRSATGTCPARGKAGWNHLTEEDMSMDASVVESLGSPAEIAETAVCEFRRRRNLLSRSRLAAFCTFVLLPLPALLLAWMAAMTVLIGAGSALDWLGGPGLEAGDEASPTEILLLHVEMMGVLMAPAVGVSIVFGRLARKTSHIWRWGVTACLLVALGTALVYCQFQSSDTFENSVFIFGLRLGRDHVRVLDPGQFFVPLAAGLMALRRSAAKWRCEFEEQSPVPAATG